MCLSIHFVLSSASLCVCSAEDLINTEHEAHGEGEELHTLIKGEGIAEAASLLMVLSSLLCFF